MKGRSFKSKPVPPRNEIVEYFSTTQKPWLESAEKVYIWKSSIPEKWVKLKGQKFFKHKSQIKHPRLSINHLQNPEKYVKEFNLNNKNSFATLHTHKEEKSEPFESRRASMFISKNFPDKSLFVTGKSSPNFISNNSRPNTVNKRPASMTEKIEEFFARFNKKKTLDEQPLANKGLLGSKLKSIREMKKKIYYCKIFNVQKASDNPFANLQARRTNSIS